MKLRTKNDFIEIFGILLFLMYSCQSVQNNPDSKVLERQSEGLKETIQALPESQKREVDNFRKSCLEIVKDKDAVILALKKENETLVQDKETLKQKHEKEIKNLRADFEDALKKAEIYDFARNTIIGIVIAAILYGAFKLIMKFKVPSPL